MAAAGIATGIAATPIRRCFRDRMAGGGMMTGAVMADAMAMAGGAMTGSSGATAEAMDSRGGIRRRRSRVVDATGTAIVDAGATTAIPVAIRRPCSVDSSRNRREEIRRRRNRAVGATAIASLTSTADRLAADAEAAVGVSTTARLRLCSEGRRSLLRRKSRRAARARVNGVNRVNRVRASRDHAAMIVAGIAVETAEATAMAMAIATTFAAAATSTGATPTRRLPG